MGIRTLSSGPWAPSPVPALDGRTGGPAHLQQRALHRDLAVHAGPLLGAHRAELLLLQREDLRAGQHSQRIHGPERGQRGAVSLPANQNASLPSPLPITSRPASRLSNQQHPS